MDTYLKSSLSQSLADNYAKLNHKYKELPKPKTKHYFVIPKKDKKTKKTKKKTK